MLTQLFLRVAGVDKSFNIEGGQALQNPLPYPAKTEDTDSRAGDARAQHVQGRPGTLLPPATVEAWKN